MHLLRVVCAELVMDEDDRQELEDFIRNVVRAEVFDQLDHGCVSIWGNISKKRLGEIVADALMANRMVVIDGRQVKMIAGHKPIWR